MGKMALNVIPNSARNTQTHSPMDAGFRPKSDHNSERFCPNWMLIIANEVLTFGWITEDWLRISVTLIPKAGSKS